MTGVNMGLKNICLTESPNNEQWYAAGITARQETLVTVNNPERAC